MGMDRTLVYYRLSIIGRTVVAAWTIVKRDPPLLIVDPVSEPHSRELLVLGPQYGFGLARRIEQVSAGCGRPGGSGVRRT